MSNINNMNKNVLALAVCSLLTACGGEGDGSGGAGDSIGTGTGPKDFTLSGSVSGLTGTLDLFNTKNQETVSIAGNSFAFSQKLADQEQYDISLASKADGQQLCEVVNGAGVVAAASVTDIEIVCRDWVAAATNLNVVSSADSSSAGDVRWPKITRVDDALEVTWYGWTPLGYWISKRPYTTDGWGAEGLWIKPSELTGYQDDSHKLVANTKGDSMLTFNAQSSIIARDSVALLGPSYSNQAGDYEYNVDIDEQGHVLLVWVAPDDLVPSEQSLYYKYFDGSWGTEVKVETNATGNVKNPVVKFIGNGVAVAAWEFATHPSTGLSYTYDGIQVSSFDASKTTDQWTADSSVDTANGTCGLVIAKSIEIDVTEDGTPAVAWMQGDGQCGSASLKQPLQISKLEQSSWSAPINVSGVDSLATSAKILSLTGNEILAAYNNNGKTYAKTCDMTTGVCASATELAAQDREIQSLAKDKNNNVMAAWLERDTADNPKDLYVNTYNASNDSWSVMGKINNDTVDISNNVAALDEEFVVTWAEYIFPGRWAIFAKEFKAQ
jgi:hypothetical protein